MPVADTETARLRTPLLQVHDAALAHGSRQLWSGLDVAVGAGEFLAVLGANGSGKTSLLRAILGLQPLSSGTVTLGGRPVRRGSQRIGYVQQQRRIDPLTPLRAKDVVRQGLDGHRWGFALPRRVAWEQVAEALAAVDATPLADTPVGTLSGGEQQRIRVAQALVGDPQLLLCDEPLLSLDPAGQSAVTGLVARRCRAHRTPVVFVTHDINPVLAHVDRVLYLANGRFRIGTVAEVLNPATLGELYGAPIDVFRSRGRIVVAGVPTSTSDAHHLDDDQVR